MHPSTFEYPTPTTAQQHDMAFLRDTTANYAKMLDVMLPPGADKTYVMRKLREIGMWANVALTRFDDGTPRTETYKGVG